MADKSRYALLIAVSHYEHEELSALPKTLRDVVDMHDTLVQSYGFAPERVRILWDHPPVTNDAAIFEAEGEQSQLSADHRQLLVQSATEQNIPLAVEEFLSDKVNPNDFRLLYYSGHGLQSGAGEFYLALRQSKPDKAAIGIAGSALKSWIKNGSKRQLLILDSCNAAAMMADAKGALLQVPVDFLGDEAVDDQQPMAWKDRGEGRFLLAASKKYQAALQTLQFKPEWRNSVYTHHLLAGLRNYAAADAEFKVTPHSLHNYVMERVPGDTSGNQEPRLQALDGTGVSFVLAKKPKLPEDLIAQIDSDSWKDRQAAVARLKADYRNPRCEHQSLVDGALKRLNQDADKRVRIEAHDALVRLGLLDESSAGKVNEQKPWAKIAIGLLLLGLASKVIYEREGLQRWASQLFNQDRATLQKAIANQQWQVAEQMCKKSVPLRSSTLCRLASSPYKAMAVIPAGNFTMGSPASEEDRDDDEQPHKVDIRSFKMGKYAVTNEWYVEFLNDGPHSIPSEQPWFETQAADDTSRIIKRGNSYAVEKGYENYPAVNISWYGANSFVRWLNKEHSGGGYRLPSEAEWEYAARAGTDTAYWWGNSIKIKYEPQANCRGCGSQWDGREPAPVDAFQANSFGLYNTLGNTWEWVEDCYSGYDILSRDGGAKTDNCSSGGSRVLRGGSWNYLPRWLRSATRNYFRPNSRNNNVGFRVAQDL